MNEEIYLSIFNMVLRSLKSKDDEDEKELAMDLADAALIYTAERASWNWLSLEERDANDGARTRKHNHLIDCFNIYLRYESKKYGTELIDLSVYDRKTIGDMGNHLICDLAIAQR